MHSNLPARQSGAAALEFALVLSLMLLLLAGLVGMGALFWARQQLASVAGDSAQAALWGAARAPADVDEEQLRQLACASAGRSMGSDRVSCSEPDDCPAAAPAAPPGSEKAACVQVQVEFPACGWTGAAGLAANCVSVRIALPAHGWPLLGMAGRLADAVGGKDWFPDVLTARAMLQIPRSQPSEPEPAT